MTGMAVVESPLLLSLPREFVYLLEKTQILSLRVLLSEMVRAAILSN